MKNFIFIAVFVAVLAVGTTGYSEKSEELVGNTAEGISFEELKAQDEEIIAKISVGVADAKEAMKLIDEHMELIKEVTKLQNAKIEKMLREMTDGREEYRKAIEKYFSSE
jgi:D-arabinose 1-dehydrogenase-like Zn-dependent alcohol dehydrogenase